MINLNTKFSNTTFKKVGFNSSSEIFRLLESVSESNFVDNNLVTKEVFIERLVKLIKSIESTGSTLQEAKEMHAQGSIGESWLMNDYKYLRQSYIEERKKLKKQLELIKVLFKT